MTEFDTIVVGAGIAGASAAMHLRLLGWSVAMLHEPHTASGCESLSPPAMRDVAALSIELGVPISELVAWWGSNQEHRAPYPGARIVDRTRLAESIRGRASECGVQTFERGTPLELDRLNEQWSVRFQTPGLARDYILQSPFIVDATGRSAVIGRRLGSRRTNADELFCISYCLEGPQRIGTWTESTPNGWWNVCSHLDQCTFSFHSTATIIRKARLDISPYLREASHLNDLFPNPKLNNPRIRMCSSSRLSPCAGNGWLAVGDAAWTVQPLASAGVAKALRDARMAAGELHHNPITYDRFQATEFESYLLRLRQHYSLEQRWRTPFWDRYRRPLTD